MRLIFPLGRLFDIPVGVHVSWLPVYAFMTLSIAANVSSWPRPIALGLAAVCALLLFASVVVHELGHALTARRFGVRTTAITLFLFGGVATLEREPPSPRSETIVALAGPLTSALVAAAALCALLGIRHLVHGPLGEFAAMTAAYLTLANAVLALFNLVPAYPMDGGRVLRAALWHTRRSYAAATGAAALVGLVAATALTLGGTVAAIVAHAPRDLWYTFLGAFLLRTGWREFIAARTAERLEKAPHVIAPSAASEADWPPSDGRSLGAHATT